MGIVEELELLGRRARILCLGLPVVLLVGFGAGKLLGRVLSVREGKPVRIVARSAGTGTSLSPLSWKLERARQAGDTTAHYIRVYRDEIAPVEHVLRRRGIPFEVARQVAWPLVEHANDAGVDPATVLSVMLIESAGQPDATSSVGARGLMQVMPSWAGYYHQCGRDLYQIEDNLCYGTKILAYFLDRHRGDERKALLGYNGCVRGTVTPNCRLYPEKVDRVRRQVRNELATVRSTAPAAAMEQ
jgi:soluble lytic murein transglycosylase-like protein